MASIVFPEKKEKISDPKAGKPHRVILYNDDWHTFEEVIRQLVLATRCSVEEAEAHAWTVHTQGRDIVFHGNQEACQKAAQILRQIRLQTEVDSD